MTRRWCAIKEYITADQDQLQRIEIYAEENKEFVKAENKGFNYTRLLLVPKKEQSTPKYIISKISRV